MKKPTLFLSLLSSTLIVGGAVNLENVNKEVEARDASIIVRVNGYENLTPEQRLAKQNNVLGQIRSYITTNYTVKERYVNATNAFLVEVPSAYVNQIRNLNSVKYVDYNKEMVTRTFEADLKRDRKNVVAPTEALDNYSAETMQAPASSNEGEGVLIAVLDTGAMVNATIGGQTGVTHKAFTALDSSVQVKETQASLKAKIDGATRFYGKYDATHSTYWNNKVPFYYDYGSDNSMSDGDFDVYCKDDEHGNHVASIAAGNDPFYKGVAPKAQIAVMKVFTETYSTDADGKTTMSSGASDNVVLKALEDCSVLGVDVINMSFGGSMNDFTDSLCVKDALANLQKEGCFLCAAAGNEGRASWDGTAYQYFATNYADPGFVSDYAIFESTVSVASTHATKIHYDSALIIGDRTVSYKDQITNTTSDPDAYNVERFLTDLLDVNPSGQFNWIKIPGLGSEDDFKTLPDGAVTGKIAIIDRGSINFSVKISNAVHAGAIAVGIIDNDASNTDFSFRMDLGGDQPSVPVVCILNRDKIFFDTATETTCTLLVDKLLTNPISKTMSEFSSDGPTYDLRIKPEIATPGTSVYGAVYLDNDEVEQNDVYDYYDGTSMASPNFAGSVALLLSDHLGDDNFKKTLMNRTMSTAEPMKDLYGTNFDLVRKQGAGLLDLKAAGTTDVYFDASIEAEKFDGKAKVELKNNDDIKAGKVALSFAAYNESNAAKTYTATTYIYRPETGATSNDNYTVLLDKELVTLRGHLIDQVTNSVTINPGRTVINLPEYQISGAEKEKLDSYFEEGAFIEGYVVFTADGQETLSIPFLGYYGDRDDAAPVEPFAFEKKADKVYQSDVFNEFMNVNLSKIGNFGSEWAMGYFKSKAKVNLNSYMTCQSQLSGLSDGNSTTVKMAKTNPFKASEYLDQVYTGDTEQVNTMIITQFVNRPVETNVITIKNRSTGQVVATDHMYDYLMGADKENNKEVAWPLYRTGFATSLYTRGYYAHRAYSVIPLYDANGAAYPDGEYEIEFNYTLLAGGNYSAKYNLVIDNKAPTYQSFENVTVDGVEYIRVRVSDSNLSCLGVNSRKFQFKQDDLGYYYDIKKSDYTSKNYILTEVYDLAYGKLTGFTHVDDENFVTLINKNLSAKNDFTYTKEDSSNNSFKISFSVTASKKATTLKDDTYVMMKLPEGFLNGTLKVQNVAKDGTVSDAEFSVANGFITIKATSTVFIVTNTTPGGDVTPTTKGCSGIISNNAPVYLGVFTLTLALSACLVLLKKKHE